MGAKDSKNYHKARKALKASLEETTLAEAASARPEAAIGGGLVGAFAGAGIAEMSVRAFAPDLVGSTEHILIDVAAGTAGAAFGVWAALYLSACGLDEMQAQAVHKTLKHAGVKDSTILRILEDEDLEDPYSTLIAEAKKSMARRAHKKRKGKKKGRRNV